MKTVATLSDSVENSIYDPSRSVATIRDMRLDPVVMVSRFYDADGNYEEMDVAEIIDGVFDECDVSAYTIGYLTNDSILSYMAGKLMEKDHAPVVARPSLISESGDILVDENVYHAFVNYMMSNVKIVIVNSFEAELLSGFECSNDKDYMRSAKKIHNTYGCHVIVTPSEGTYGKLVACVGDKTIWFDMPSSPEGFDPNKYEFATAIACGLAYGFSSMDSIEFAMGLCSGTKTADDILGKEEVKPSEAEPEPAAEDKTAEAAPVPRNEKPAESVSFVSPGKALRDIARNIESEFGTADKTPAVTSVIDEHLNKPRGEVMDITSRKSVNDTVTELQALKDRLEKLKESAK